MKKLLALLFLIGLSIYSQGQDIEKPRVFILENADAAILEGLPKEITLKPSNGLLVLENEIVDGAVFNQKGTKVKFEQSAELTNESHKYILKIIEAGTLTGKVKIENKNYSLEYAEYIKCQNEDHDPNHLCKVGEPRNECAEEDCVF